MVQTPGVRESCGDGQNLSGCRHNRRLSGENAAERPIVKLRGGKQLVMPRNGA